MKEKKQKRKAKEPQANAITVKIFDNELSIAGYEDLDELEKRIERLIKKYMPKNTRSNTHEKRYFG